MNDLTKKRRLRELREQDRQDFEAPLGAYQPHQERSWLDSLAYVDHFDELDLNEFYCHGG